LKIHCGKFSIVAGTAIDTDSAENIIPLLLFTTHCLVTAGCCDSRVLALSEYAHLQNAGKNHKIANIFFQNVAKFKYLKMTATYQNWIMRKLRADKVWVMPVTIQFRNFFLLVCYLKT
jgi:hypothetical protein